MSSSQVPQIPRTIGALPASAEFVEDLYRKWQADPESVSSDWRLFFLGFEAGLERDETSAVEVGQTQAKVDALVEAYRQLGHLIAQIDPLGGSPDSHVDLALSRYGLGEADKETIFQAGLGGDNERATLAEISEVLRSTYCRSVGVEYLHNSDTEVRRWLQERMESTRNRPDLTREQKLAILGKLVDAEVFETFIQKRYPGQKRFSLEGAEALIPALHFFMEAAADSGVEEVVVGMAHRGRLNVLANILDKPYSMIFFEFEDIHDPNFVDGDGDVKYHRGFTSTHASAKGKQLKISLTANPSHLEAVDPVVEGRVRAKQRRLADTKERRRVVPLLLHGDAAFAGQGLIAETLNLSQLPGYQTGGTVHIIINNQIGFTTSPDDARSTHYSSDVAKMVGAPIFHVNGDDPEALVFAVLLVLEFRQRFGIDVVLDMVCYRRHGHNEADEPAFTQPLLYKKIRNRPTVRELYTQSLVECCELTSDEGERITQGFQTRLEEAFQSARQRNVDVQSRAFENLWEGLDNEYSHEPAETGVERERLIDIARALTTIPEGFQLNPKIARHLPKRFETVENGGFIDWSYAELLALGSLASEALPVRLSGQDSARGTFSQRHAVWKDMETQETYVPLRHIHADQATFCVYNSMLSEAAVLGFDYGYALTEPQMLVLWEAQFGDFANGAQVIIDQFITSSGAKWQRNSGIVMLLPHGYEGQGPEHSNAYLDRYLSACAEDNIQVCNLTTPANYFHALRRQLKRDFRLPLVVMAPKSLLRHPQAVSPVQDLIDGRFQEVIGDSADPAKVTRLLLCAGKVYYDLHKHRQETGRSDVAIVRVEQFYPFPLGPLKAVLSRYREVPVYWVQEETRNRGGWTFMMSRFLREFPDRRLLYVGRPPGASPATGSLSVHKREQQEIMTQAFERAVKPTTQE